MMLSHRDDYHASVLLSSANAVTGGVYRSARAVTGYFHLRQINESLQESNAALENEILNLRNRLDEYRAALSDTVHVRDENRYDYILAIRAITSPSTVAHSMECARGWGLSTTTAS